MKVMKKLGFIGTLAALISAPAFGARFANQFIEFELPPQWQCALEGAEWVCQSTQDGKKRDAIIVLAAKLKGDQDSLDQYFAYLKGQKNYVSVQGKPIKSEVKYAKTATLNDHPWVDSLHLESEIPGFYTRYLATVKADIGVLVTYSINKDKYSSYLSDFENLVKTLKVFRKPGLGLNANPNSNIFQNTTIPQGVTGDTVFGGVTPQGGAEGKVTTKKKPQDDDTLLFILIGLGALGFILWKRKKG